MCILRPDPSLWPLLGAHAAPSQLLVHTIIGAVHLLQQAPGLIKTENGTLRKEFHAHDIFGFQGMPPLPCLPKEHRWDRGHGGTGTTITPDLQHSQTPYAYERFLRVGYAFPTRTRTGAQAWHGGLGGSVLGARCSEDVSSFGAVVSQPLYGGKEVICPWHLPI